MDITIEDLEYGLELTLRINPKSTMVQWYRDKIAELEIREAKTQPMWDECLNNILMR